eukprot:805906-Rhodomonas_salina.1
MSGINCPANAVSCFDFAVRAWSQLLRRRQGLRGTAGSVSFCLNGRDADNFGGGQQLPLGGAEVGRVGQAGPALALRNATRSPAARSPALSYPMVAPAFGTETAFGGISLRNATRSPRLKDIFSKDKVSHRLDFNGPPSTLDPWP